MRTKLCMASCLAVLLPCLAHGAVTGMKAVVPSSQLNPQPEPPLPAMKAVVPSSQLNPQPEPPLPTMKKVVPSSQLNPQPEPPLPGKVISIRGMKLQQLQALADNAKLENNGVKFTKRELMTARDKARAESLRKTRAANEATVKAISKYNQQQKANIRTANAQVAAFAGGFGRAVSKVQSMLAPTITEVKGNLTPGGQIALKGSGFGTTKGEIVFVPPGMPKTLVPIDKWFDDGVLATVPYMTGVHDGQSAIVLTTAAGKTATTSAQFTAMKSIEAVPPDMIKVGTCSTAATLHNKCFVDSSSGIYGIAAAEHENFPGDPATSGSDTYTVPGLKNGWKLTDYSGLISMPSFGGPTCKTTSPTSGTCSWQTETSFSGIKFTSTGYGHTVYAEGPKGVPMR